MRWGTDPGPPRTGEQHPGQHGPNSGKRGEDVAVCVFDNGGDDRAIAPCQLTVGSEIGATKGLRPMFAQPGCPECRSAAGTITITQAQALGSSRRADGGSSNGSAVAGEWASRGRFHVRGWAAVDSWFCRSTGFGWSRRICLFARADIEATAIPQYRRCRAVGVPSSRRRRQPVRGGSTGRASRVGQWTVTLGTTTGGCSGSNALVCETPSGVRMSIAFGTVPGSTPQISFAAAIAAGVQTPNA